MIRLTHSSGSAAHFLSHTARLRRVHVVAQLFGVEPKLGLKAGVGGGIFRGDGFGLGGHVKKGAGDCVKLRRALETDKLLLKGIDALPLPNSFGPPFDSL